MTSNPVQLVAIDMTKQLQLEVSATAQSKEINVEPAVVEFAITVRNVGIPAGKDLVIKHGKTAITTIPALEPGEEVTVIKSLLVSMGGKFQFTVSGVNAQGVTQDIPMKEEDAVQVAYVEPTPPPPPTAVPTAPPEEEEETPIPVGSGTSDEDGGLGLTLLWAFAGVIALALVGVLAMIVVGRRRGSSGARGDAIVDSIERGTRRDYAQRPTPARARGDTQRMRAQQEASLETVEEGMEDFDHGYDADRPADEGKLAADSSLHELAAMYGRPERGAHLAGSRSADEAASAYLDRMRGAEPAREKPPSDLGDTAAYRRRRARNADA